MTNEMFPTGEDLPTFSGTCQKVTISGSPALDAEIRQTKMAACPICFDTGSITVKGKEHRCWCQAAQQETVVEELLNRPSKRLARVQRNAAYHDPQDGETERVIKEASALDTPANRFAVVGCAALSTLELLTVLVGEQSPIIPARIIAKFHTLSTVHHAATTELAAVKGMTPRKAMIVQCALELAQPREQPESLPMVRTPSDCAQFIGPQMHGLGHEEMRVLSLSVKNRILSTDTIYRGSLHTTVIRTAQIFRPALSVNAAAIIVLHNHPSGDPTPSPEDVAVTRELVNAGKILDIDLLDHIIIGESPAFLSLKERGLGF